MPELQTAFLHPAKTRLHWLSMATIHATYEAVVFRPHAAVNLPEHCEVEFEPRVVHAAAKYQPSEQVYQVLSERYQSGESNVAERHNEHQPGPQ